MVEAAALTEPWQVVYRTGGHAGLADTVKEGAGGSAGMRPHELLEASLATCMTISARMALADLGVADAGVSVRVHLEREEPATRSATSSFSTRRSKRTGPRSRSASRARRCVPR
ncbi:OsmC family protein [Streptomyces albus]|uniref:OsmC family protein n=1 Tax=Streptomyces albus TaxID=1888 RepID=A0A8H1QUP7_9ACTN|nr:OsmC family protein [Streptomyces albus]TGG86507.1 hypothetical protein D8771_09235 [Streptomyces albus]UVN53135.1 OsmC family protein [Streptomyces albus]